MGRYDGDCMTAWIEMTAAAEWVSRYAHTGVVMPDSSIILMGGYSGGIKNDVWKSTDSGSHWTQVTAHADWAARMAHTSVIMPDGSIVLMGGKVAGIGIAQNDVWRSTDKGVTWTLMTAAPGWRERFGHASVVMSDGSIILTGGYSASFHAYQNDVWRSTDNGSTWVQQQRLPGWTARSSHSSVALSDGSIVVMGGEDGGGDRNDVWRSTDNGITWVRQTASAGWFGRFGHTSVAMPDDSIILMGGNNASSFGFNDIWRSTDMGVTWVQTTAGADWAIREDHVSVLMPDTSIVIMGGVGFGALRTDVWRNPPMCRPLTSVTSGDPVVLKTFPSEALITITATLWDVWKYGENSKTE